MRDDNIIQDPAQLAIANQRYQLAQDLLANNPSPADQAKILCYLMTAAVRNHAPALNELLNCLAQPSYNRIFSSSAEIQKIFLFEFFNCLYFTSHENQAEIWPKLTIPEEDFSFASASLAERCYQMGCYLVDESRIPNQHFDAENLYRVGIIALSHAYNCGYREAGNEILRQHIEANLRMARQQHEARRPALEASHAGFFARLAANGQENPFAVYQNPNRR